MIETEGLLPERHGLEDLVARFAFRTGGVSEGNYGSLNLGFSSGDRAECVIENRRRLAAHLGVPTERWIVGGQVHGADVAVAGADLAGEGALAASERLQHADAVFLPEPGVFALALSADCPLVVIADPAERTAGIAHAGWRGTAAGVVEALVREFERAGSRPADLVAGISPGICGACYPVGEEVFAALAGNAALPEARDGDHLDLRTIHEAALVAAGIPHGAIRRSPTCSACSAEIAFSHRRDGPRTGRNGALVGWRAGR